MSDGSIEDLEVVAMLKERYEDYVIHLVDVSSDEMGAELHSRLAVRL